MTTNTRKTMVIGIILTIFTFAAVSAYAWGNRQHQGRGMGQGQHLNSKMMVDNSDTSSVNGNAGELKGRDYVRLGQIQELNGTLKLEGTEWFLNVGEKTYALHMGPEAYRESIGFSLGDENPAVVTGFVYNDDIAVKQVTSDNKSIVLRDETGRPVWAGSKFSNRQASSN